MFLLVSDICEAIQKSGLNFGGFPYSALCKSAELVLGRAKRRNPDWFQELELPPSQAAHLGEEHIVHQVAQANLY